MFKIIKKIFSTSFVNVISIFASLFINFFLARVFGASGVGLINVSNKVLNVASVFCQTGLRAIILRDNAEIGYTFVSKSIRTSIFINGIISIITTIVLITFISFFGNLITEESKEILYAVTISILALFPVVISQLISSFLAAKKSPILATLFDQTGVVILTGSVLFFLYYFSKIEFTIYLILYIFLASRVFFLIFVILLLQNKNFKLLPLLFSTKYLKEGRNLYINSLIGVLTSNLDIFVVTYFLSIDQVGVYAIASRLGLFLGFIEKVIMTVSGPEIVKIYKSSRIIYLSSYIRNLRLLLSFTTFIALIIYGFFGKEILMFFGDEFLSAYNILLILSFSTFIRLSSGPNGLLLTMAKLDRIKMNIGLVSFILLLALSIPLTIKYGLYGAAFARLSNVIWQSGLQIFYSRKLILLNK